MKIVSKIVLGVLVLTLLGAVVLSIDVARDGYAQTIEPNKTGSDNTTPIEMGNQVTIIDESIGLEMDLVPLDVVNNALVTAVTNGVLTQAEADAILTDIDSQHIAHLSGLGTVEIIGEEVIELLDHEEAIFSSGTHIMPASGHGAFFAALHRVVADGTLVEEAMHNILRDFSELAGEAVTVELPEGGVDEAYRFFITIDGDDNLRAAMETALNNAVAAGNLSTEQAEAILTAVDETPDMDMMPHIEGMPFIELEDHFVFSESAPLADLLAHRLQEAVENGKLSQDAADDLLATLDELLK